MSAGQRDINFAFARPGFTKNKYEDFVLSNSRAIYPSATSATINKPRSFAVHSIDCMVPPTDKSIPITVSFYYTQLLC